jgi:hypothetical protein
MGGEVLLDAEGQDRVAIEIRTGAVAVSRANFRIHLDLDSQAVSTLCEAGLSHMDASFLSAEEARRFGADAIITDAGGALEAHRVRSLRDRFPEATLIGVGAADAPWAFDALLPLPLNVALLRSAVQGAQAG